jgi:transcriptional regulator with XRE-family HTH domain
MRLDPDAITTVRKARGMSQQELADAVGCSQQAISDYERGIRGSGRQPGKGGQEVSSKVAHDLARGLGVTVEAITVSEPDRAVSA